MAYKLSDRPSKNLRPGTGRKGMGQRRATSRAGTNRKFPEGYPEETVFHPWRVVLEKDRHDEMQAFIRRTITVPGHKNTINERLPFDQYRDFQKDMKRLQDFVTILNNKDPKIQRAKEKQKFRHAWIDDEIVNHFLSEVKGEHTKDDRIRNIEHYVRHYFMDWFTLCLDVADMNRWHYYQRTWGYALLNKLDKIEWTPSGPRPSHIKDKSDLEVLRIWDRGHEVSYYTVTLIIQTANRFLSFLSMYYPEKMDNFLALRPLSPAQLKTLKAETDIRSRKRKWFIPDSDWAIIESALNGKSEKEGANEVAVKMPPYPILAYRFGLRRQESMALRLEDVTDDGLTIERQFEGYDEKGKRIESVTKGKLERKVPYKYVAEARGPKGTYDLIEKCQDVKMRVDGYSKLWSKLMDKLKMPYRLHDLRRTWVTRCFRNKELAIDDIRKAAGHVEIQTTEGYRIDEKLLLKKSWVPGDDSEE